MKIIRQVTNRENSFLDKYINEIGKIKLISAEEEVSLARRIHKGDYGWAGFNTARNKEHVDTVLANKVLEYISCGLPVISLGHKTQQEFIEENGIGIVINEIGELSSRLREEPELNEIRSRVLECRQYFTIEDKIRQVLDFYKSFT